MDPGSRNLNNRWRTPTMTCPNCGAPLVTISECPSCHKDLKLVRVPGKNYYNVVAQMSDTTQCNEALQ